MVEASTPTKKADDPRSQRAEQPPTVLGAKTIEWIDGLPQHLRPTELASRFPHIVNNLAARWQAPEVCRAYFDEILLDRRGSRRGLPERVAVELAALKNHFDSVVFPTQQTVWDEIVKRSRG